MLIAMEGKIVCGYVIELGQDGLFQLYRVSRLSGANDWASWYMGRPTQ